MASHKDDTGWLGKLWTQVGASWRQEFKLCPHNEDLGSWLFAQRSGGIVTSLGCKACYLTDGKAASWATHSACRRAKLRAHALQPSHARAVAALGLCDKCKAAHADALHARMAPPLSAFEQAWGARCSGTVGRKGVAGVAGARSRKRAQLEFCVAEAMRMHDRKHLKKCETLVTHVDGKGKYLSMRVSATSTDLVPRKIFLGHVRHANAADSVEAYVASVKRLLQEFCTEGHDAPMATTRPADSFSQENQQIF